MGIEVRHSPDLRVVGAAAQKAGEGQYNKWRQNLALQESQIASRERMHRLSIAAQQEAQRVAGQQSMDRMKLQSELGIQAGQADLENRMAYEDYRYSAQQKAQVAQIQEQMQWVDNREDWTPEEKMHAKRQLEGKLLGIKPLMQLKEEKPTAEQEVQTRVHPVDGGAWVMQPDGKLDFKEIKGGGSEGKGQSFKEQLSLRKEIVSAATKLMAMRDADGNPLYSYEQAMQEAENLYGGLGQAFGSADMAMPMELASSMAMAGGGGMLSQSAAAGAAVGGQPQLPGPMQQPQQQGPPVLKPNDTEAFNSLPSGAQFYDEHGNLWMKP